MTPQPFRLGYVPGVTPAKWARTWSQRHRTPLELVPLEAAQAEHAVREGEVCAALLRPPVDRDLLSAIVLYEETAVVVVPTDHVIAALEDGEEVTLADLDTETVLHCLDEVLDWPNGPPGSVAEHRPESTAAAIALVAAGAGVLVVPQSLARLHHRRDLTYRSLAGGPTAPVALSWVTDQKTDEIEDMIGIVRGRTVNSSRGRPTGAPAKEETPTGASRRDRSAGRTANSTGGGARRPRGNGARPGRPGGRRPRRGKR
ncbi:LysR family transcriptional regulator substrate-binding protein [Ruania halotolerans]|uniref:LysR family transcriptional regulator substrate-binding protein n=1 Tax=Ruania halotolerans TaxID=2897773 RepID=UPI001E33E388|nr:LysR family transcriptional regulator substrate-binding protein [Ruania halotolerans]UFU05843.1 LysR family transcriptional regulator substrate-binding protein [Ruania halotolerans]